MFILEQPKGSIMELHPLFQAFLRLLNVLLTWFQCVSICYAILFGYEPDFMKETQIHQNEGLWGSDRKRHLAVHTARVYRRH